MLNRSCENGHSYLVADFSRKAFIFSLLSVMLAVGLPEISFIVLRYVPSIPTLVRVFVCLFRWWMDVEFYQMFFMHLLRWSCGFCFFFCSCGVSHWLLCLCWHILVILGWIQLCYGVWSFLHVVGFNLLIFCWEFLHVYSSDICLLFSFLLVPLSGFDIRVM